MNGDGTSFAVVRSENTRAGYYSIVFTRHAQEWGTEMGFRTVAQDLTQEQATALRDLLNASE